MDLHHQKLLLRPNHGARPTDSDPSDGLGRCHPVMLHDVAGDERACPSKASWKKEQAGDTWSHVLQRFAGWAPLFKKACRVLASLDSGSPVGRHAAVPSESPLQNSDLLDSVRQPAHAEF